MTVEALRERYRTLPVTSGFCDETLGRRCCALALEALEAGSYGVGAVLVDVNGEILAEGWNRVFEQRYRASAHAEMELLDRFEARYPSYGDRSGLTLVVSLEPCPMCLARILLSGIGQVRYLCPDPDGGMASRLRHLPPAWRNLAGLTEFKAAHISGPLRELAAKLAESGLSSLRKQLISQIRPG